MGSSPDNSNRSGMDRLSAVTIHNLRSPLTIIKAQAQMVERWVHRNDMADADVTLQRLQTIDAMVTRLVGELDALREEPASNGPDAPENGLGER